MRPGSTLIRQRQLVVFLLIVGVSLTLALLPVTASAHAELKRSLPAEGAALGSGPAKLELWFTEGLTPSGSSAKVYDAQRREVDKGDDKVDPADPTHLTVSLQPLSDGTYTVVWTSVSRDDGHVIDGTFTFTVGVSRLPGAAPTSSTHPSLAEIALRWLVFLGLMIPAGWFLLGLLGFGLESLRRPLVAGGALVALMADLLLLPVTAFWPGSGLPSQSLADTYSIMPQAWLARLMLEAAILLLVAVVLARHRQGTWIDLTGMALSGAAIVALALTTHAEARSSDHLLALTSEIVHLETVAFWMGGLAWLALLPKAARARVPGETRRFSRLAFILAPLAIASGIVNAGLTLPSFASLTQSSYGKILVVKIVFVAGLILFAWLNRRAVHAGALRAVVFARSLRVELAFGAATILIASVLALWAPPQATRIIPLRLSQSTGNSQVAHLVVDPAHDGPNRIEAWLTGDQDKPVAGVSSVVAQFSMLERQIDLPDVSLQATSTGHFTARDVPLTVQGWWDLKLIFGQGAGTSTTAEFFFMVPDPVLAGGLHQRASDAAARNIFGAAIAQIGTLSSMRTQQTLSDGVGNSVDTVTEYEAPNKFAYQTNSNEASIAIGTTQWYRQGDQPWTKNRRVDSFAFPHTLTTYYEGATEFTLGRTQMLDGEECQIITFSVPAGPGQGAAWYAWWVGKTTHLLRREAMVADHHYMINHNIDFNSPSIAITPPAGSAP